MIINNAIYIKLGEGGKWEKDSIENGRIRIGWPNIPIELIGSNQWDIIYKIIKKEFDDRGKKMGAQNDFNALKHICEADETTVFITFYSGKMYWCVSEKGSINEDETSKFLNTQAGWSDKNIPQTRTFEIHQLSGRLTKYQLFLGTACGVNNKLRERDCLIANINGCETEEYQKLYEARAAMKEAIIPAIKSLTPKDFEIAIDLIFRNSGWKRTSVLGETMKFFDLILEEPFTKKLHGVQIKSSSNFKRYKEYVDTFINEYQNEFETFFYAVHTPDKKLEDHTEENHKIKLLHVSEIADLAIDSGLISWIMEKSK